MSSAEGPLVVRYTVTLDDFIDAQTSQIRRLVAVRTAACVVVVLLGVLLVAGGDAAIGTLAIALGALGLVLIHVRPVRRAFIRRRVAPLLGVESEVTLTEEGISIVQTSSRGVLAWSGLTKVDETGGGVSVLAGGVVRLTIPKRAFRDRTHAEAYISELRRRIESARPG